jgi:hypothetical protein
MVAQRDIALTLVVVISIVSTLTVITLWPGQPASHELTKDNDPLDTLDHDPSDEVPYEVPYPLAFSVDLACMEDDGSDISCQSDQGGADLPKSEMTVAF